MTDLITDPDAPGYSAMAVVVAGLTAQARGEEVDQDAMEDAATLMAVASLAEAGMPVETIRRMFEERDYQFRFTYDGATDEIGVSVEWLDGDDGPSDSEPPLTQVPTSSERAS